MTGSKSPFGQPPIRRQSNENYPEQPGFDQQLNWPSQNGFDPRYQPAPQADPTYYPGDPQQTHPHQEFGQAPFAGHPQDQFSQNQQQPAHHDGGYQAGGQPGYHYPSDTQHHPHDVPQTDPYAQSQLRPAVHDQFADQGHSGHGHGGHAPASPHDWQAQPAAPPTDYNQADYSQYDLGNYKPVGTGERPGFGEPGYAPNQNWDDGSAQFHPNHSDPNAHYADQTGAPQGHYPGQGQGAVTQQGDAYAAEADDDYDDYDEYEDDEGSGTRKFIIAAALVSTIVVGGGFAYGYNVLFSGAPGKPGTPIVKAETSPSKIQPADPGGRKFEHTDSKLMNKLGNGNQAGADGNRVKSVSTLIVGRDGRLIVPEAPKPSNTAGSATAAAAQPASPPADNGSVSVPGMMIEGGPSPVQPQTAAVVPSVTPSQPAAAVPPAVTPRVPQVTNNSAPPAAPPATTRRRNSKFPPLPVRSGIAKPAVIAGAAVATPGATRPAGLSQANVRRVVPSATTVRPARTAPRQAAPQVTQASAANGYVAVLSTKRSRIDALTSFADLQQRYGSILSSKVPDVRRADLSSRGLGVMYRAVVGPPASRQVATQLCSRLKTAGYAGCWVAPY